MGASLPAVVLTCSTRMRSSSRWMPPCSSAVATRALSAPTVPSSVLICACEGAGAGEEEVEEEVVVAEVVAVAVAARHLRVRRRDLLVLRAHQQRARRRQALLRLGELGGGEAARLALRLELGGELALAVRPAVHFGLRLEQLRLQK